MSIKFRGDFTNVQKCVSRVNAGSWRDLEHGCRQYRTDDGAVFNWWEKSGKITFQGHGKAALEFEQAFMAIASNKGTGHG
jgi:hypothetical protein